VNESGHALIGNVKRAPPAPGGRSAGDAVHQFKFATDLPSPQETSGTLAAETPFRDSERSRMRSPLPNSGVHALLAHS
jgi:hypothetical protein